VPTFTCGLLRSNFSFATLLLLLSQSLMRAPWPELAKHTPYAPAPTGSPVRCSTISSAMFEGTSSYRSNCMV
jgi:hypothetical protein